MRLAVTVEQQRGDHNGFSKQHALLALILVFPFGLISAGFAVVMLINRQETATQQTSPKIDTQFEKEQIGQSTFRAEPLPKDRISAPEPIQTSPGLEERQLDDLADAIFWRRHPSLYGVKLSNQSGSLAREWQEIRRCDAVVDYRFYQAFPHMRGQTIAKDQTDLVAIWQNISNQVPGCS